MKNLYLLPLCRLLLLWFFLLREFCSAKKVSGDFRLTGAQTEHVLTTFAVVPTGGAMLSLNLTASFMYEDERSLSVFLYRDVEWPEYLKSTLCTKKTRLSKQRQALTFDYIDEKWKTNPIQVILVNKGANRRNPQEENDNRAHYWYIVVADCLLEQGNFDAKIPPLHFELEIVNQLETDTSKPVAYTHFSADELWLYRYHGLTLLVSGAVTVWLITTILRQVTQSSAGSSSANSLHVTVLWVTLAALLDMSSALLELMHLRIYESNGIGSYFLDALSAHSEAIADALAALLLWCVGAGWTLSTELQQRALHSTMPIARLYHDWRQPFGHVGQPHQALLGPGHVLMLLVLTGHVILAQWGRIYNDNFDSYHDYEHGPGLALMWLRLLSGALFALCTWHTHQGLQQHAAGKMLSDFYKTLLACGVVWYTGLPALTLWAKALPYYLRNGVVVVGSSLLQASVLASLAYLVTYSKALAKVNASYAGSSSAKDHSDDILPGSSLGVGAAPRLFSLGKAKIRLD